jgi:hypothetical protein
VAHKGVGWHGELHGISCYASTQRAKRRDGNGTVTDRRGGVFTSQRCPGSLATDRPGTLGIIEQAAGSRRSEGNDELNALQYSSVNTRPIGGPLKLLCCAETLERFGLHAGNIKFNTQNKESYSRVPVSTDSVTAVYRGPKKN